MFKSLKKVKNVSIFSLALFIFNFFILLEHHHFDDHHHDHESEQSCLVCHLVNYANDNQIKNTLIKSVFLFENVDYFIITLTKHEIALHQHSRAPPLKNI
jgi:hypothetical protein